MAIFGLWMLSRVACHSRALATEAAVVVVPSGEQAPDLVT
jgi:hypothetical protein